MTSAGRVGGFLFVGKCDESEFYASELLLGDVFTLCFDEGCFAH